jgi:catechol 2,3-dioxygenase-like lactoylglutathione lyase family enzyme
MQSAPASANPAPKSQQVEVEIAGPVLMVTDLERSLKFYVDGLGLRASTRLPGNPGPGAIVVAPGRGPTPFLLIRQSGADTKGAAPIVHGNALSRVMLTVPDTAATAVRLAAAGFPHAPLNARGIFFVKDPDGYSYEIMPRASGH